MRRKRFSDVGDCNSFDEASEYLYLIATILRPLLVGESANFIPV